MSTKTNKSYSKRLRVTRKGKVLARRGGKNHFNAKAKRRTQLNGKKLVSFPLKGKDLGHYLPTV